MMSTVSTIAGQRRSNGDAGLTPNMVQAADLFKQDCAQFLAEDEDGDGIIDLTMVGEHTDARYRVASALKAVSTNEDTLMAGVLSLAVGQAIPMGTVEQRLQLPARSGPVLLRAALTVIWIHYLKLGRVQA
jgi:hypothetical protein